MTDIYRIGWPVPNEGSSSCVHTNTAECLTQEAADQVREGLVAIGFKQAVVFAVEVD